MIRMEIQNMFFVAGITGKIGGATARLLIEHGHKLRSLVRDSQKAAEWLQKGVDVRQGDFNNVAAMPVPWKQSREPS